MTCSMCVIQQSCTALVGHCLGRAGVARTHCPPGGRGRISRGEVPTGDLLASALHSPSEVSSPQPR